jgi:2-polyprenyl-3-methyl-5-hydroxy-6-metoxy-1,4-benzoquinol methylase
MRDRARVNHEHVRENEYPGHGGEPPAVRQGMPETILTTLAPLVRRHPWWRARSRLALGVLAQARVHPPSRIADVGCGWGTTLESLEQAGYRATGLDIDLAALRSLAESKPTRPVDYYDLTANQDPPVRGFEAVMALDVLEHLDDDVLAARRLAALAGPCATLILSVPARPELWSEFDEIQGHRRRYTSESLRATLERAGLEVNSVFYWGQWLVPILARQRKRSKSRPGDSVTDAYARYLRYPGWPASSVFDLAFGLEQRRALAGQLRAGTSIWAVASVTSPTRQYDMIHPDVAITTERKSLRGAAAAAPFGKTREPARAERIHK